MRIIRKSRQPQYAAAQQYAVDPSILPQWQYIQAYLKASDAREGVQKDIDHAMSVLSGDMVVMAYADLIRTTFETKIVPALKHLEPTADSFVGILQNLSQGLDRYQACFARLKIEHASISGIFKALVSTNIHGSQWQEAIREWIKRAIEEERDEDLVQIHDIANNIGLSGMFTKELTIVLRTSIMNVLHDKYAKAWSDSVIDELRTENRERPTRLLNAMRLDITEQQIDQLLLEGLAQLRISELFDIIIDFPASSAALEDLKLCVKSSEPRALLVQRFTEQCNARLLHPGANTPDIITIYISTIKVFLILDPPGVLLDKVARPIRKYLRERSDTIRCIISSLLGEVDNELALELSEEQMPEEVHDEDDPLWLPDPIDAAPDYAKNRASDIIGSLISIYENKDVFTRELQTLLADRLLAITDYNIDQELRNLELLKIRFGDGMLSVCDVMLKDMNDSRRIDALIHASPSEKDEAPKMRHVLHSTIVSRLYWPVMKSSIFVSDTGAEPTTQIGYKPPDEIARMFVEYADNFARLKAQRNLVFQKELGHVRVKLELEDRELDMLVTPVHAACIHLFDEVSSLSLAQMQTMLNLSESDCRRHLSFWVKQGVLNTQDGVYTVMEVAAVMDNSAQLNTMEEVMPEVTEEVDEMSTYWNFVVGMLTNVGALEPERIHSMLGMFAPSYDKSLDQLKALLQRRTREGAVELKGGLYRLPAA